MKDSGYEYHAVSGETWDSIALKVYGQEKHAYELLHMNPHLCHKLIFTGGERITLPLIDAIAEGGAGYANANAPWKD